MVGPRVPRGALSSWVGVLPPASVPPMPALVNLPAAREFDGELDGVRRRADLARHLVLAAALVGDVFPRYLAAVFPCQVWLAVRLRGRIGRRAALFASGVLLVVFSAQFARGAWVA